MAAMLFGGSACAMRPAFGGPPAPPRTRTVILILPGARLTELSRPELTSLSDLVRRSSGAWVAAWKPGDLSSLPGTRLRIPLRHDPDWPFGIRADVGAVDRMARAALRKDDLLLIDPGDLERAERYAPLCLPAKAGEHRSAALLAANSLFGALLHDSEVRDLALLAPPLKRGAGLAPFFWLRPGGEPGLLRSGSTHMAGVITGADVAAALAASAGVPYAGSGCRVTIEPVAAVSRSVGGRSGESPLAAMGRIGALAERTDRLRAVADYLIEWLLLLLLAAGALALRAGRRLPRLLAMAPLLLPALLLADGARRAGEPLPWSGTLLLVIAGLVAAYFVERVRGDEASMSLRASVLIRHLGLRDWTLLAAVTVAACTAAVLSGDVFRWTVFGNSIRLGVRFYGVGNEFMGWWIGAAVLAAGVPEKPHARLAALALLLAVALLIGHPALGAKVGGVITALAAVAVEAWPSLRRHRALAAVAAAVAVAALLSLAVWDASRPPAAQTHLGRLVLRMAAEGPRPLLLIARGKLLTNLRLTFGLWGALLAAGAWLIGEARRHAPQEATTRAVSRLLPVAAVAFLCNDSGVIAAALMLSYGTIAAGQAWDPRFAGPA